MEFSSAVLHAPSPYRRPETETVRKIVEISIISVPASESIVGGTLFTIIMS